MFDATRVAFVLHPVWVVFEFVNRNRAPGRQAVASQDDRQPGRREILLCGVALPPQSRIFRHAPAGGRSFTRRGRTLPAPLEEEALRPQSQEGTLPAPCQEEAFTCRGANASSACRGEAPGSAAEQEALLALRIIA